MAEEIQSGFERAYRSGAAPWDIGRPQPEVVRLAEAGRISGEVLDVGCGTGENALFLAGRGARVVGIDGAPTAIEAARTKAAARGIEATFVLGDAMELPTLGRRFDTVIDCGLFHVFGDADRPRYVESLAAAMTPGATLHLLCFSDAEPPGWGPRRVGEAELVSSFRAGFRLVELRATRFATVEGGVGPHAWLASFTRR